MNYRPVTLLAAHEKSFVLSVATLLDRLGFEVIPIEGGTDALSYTKKFMPDIVLIDEALSDVNGFDVLQQIKEDSFTFFIPVIMMTKPSNRQIIENCKKMECTSYIVKPIHLLDFNRTIYDCLNSDGGKKRRHLRARFNRDVTVHYGGAVTSYLAITLSEGGIFLRDIEPLSPGEKVTVTLQLNDRTPMEIKGSVIYRKNIFGGMFNIGPGMGIAFEDMPDNTSGLIKEYLMNELTGGPHVKQHIIH